MMRIALGIEYVGDNFFGWQVQPQLRTVQGCVELALSKVADHPVRVFCAGRTDTGVHALGQVVHADVQVQRSMDSWLLGTNSCLPRDISILWVKLVDENFHARFSAQARYYRYIIFNRPVRPAILHKKVTWEYRALNVQSMQMASKYLIGTHDFSSYRAVACQAKSPIRTILSLNIERVDEKVIIDIAANGFLHHMVRNIAGVLIAIGHGKREIKWANTVLQARDRRVGGITAPADGLYFVKVDYPQQYMLPTQQDMEELS
ncbi:tRNA pseudouridine(38-40) synthase TruA [Candidatus Halobeggiatoa sp. HSG11]|nr:tRNA pseudouridine(38-40) synthase TruA [Candidatus Halobeggiatoa sp. HSG11]